MLIFFPSRPRFSPGNVIPDHTRVKLRAWFHSGKIRGAIRRSKP
jgi:hypothetical protein